MNFLYILLALAVLLVLITVHEFGHYVAGKILGFKINEFAIGFGPKIFSRTNKKTGEVFSVRVLPLGGFCAFEGEDEDNPSKDAFNNKKPWKRLIVLVSGVLFNFLFGIITAVIFLNVNGYALPCVADFSPNNPNNGILQKGDIITEVNGKSLEIYRSMSDLTKKIKKGENITLTVNRDGEIIKVKNVQKYTTEAFYYVSLTGNIEGNVFDNAGIPYSLDEFREYIKSIEPNINEETGKYEKFAHHGMFFNAKGEVYSDDDLIDLAGISLSTPADTMGFIYYNVQAHYGFFESLLKAWPFCLYICWLILSALGGLFTGATAVAELGGTVTAISQIAEISQIGLTSFLLLLPMLSMNLALFNILPIPALDGARCVFVCIEGIARKPVPRKIENIIHTVGLFVLLGLVVFLDVYHFFFI